MGGQKGRVADLLGSMIHPNLLILGCFARASAETALLEDTTSCGSIRAFDAQH